MPNMKETLTLEAAARLRLNNLLSTRALLDKQCALAYEELSAYKRHLYLLGFTGNVMRDADGNRVRKTT